MISSSVMHGVVENTTYFHKLDHSDLANLQSAITSETVEKSSEIFLDRRKGTSAPKLSDRLLFHYHQY